MWDLGSCGTQGTQGHGFCLLFVVLSPMINGLPEKVPVIENRPRLKVWLKKTCGNCVTFCILYNIFWTMRTLHIGGSSGFMAAALVK